MRQLHIQIANLCLGQDLQKCNNHLKELYDILLASEPYLGEVSKEYKADILATIQLSDEMTKILTSQIVQDFLRSQLKAVS